MKCCSSLYELRGECNIVYEVCSTRTQASEPPAINCQTLVASGTRKKVQDPSKTFFFCQFSAS